MLQEYIVSGTSEDEFKRRLKASIQESSPEQVPQPEQQNIIPQAANEEPARPPVSSAATPNVNAEDPEPVEQNATERSRRESIREGKRRANLEPPKPTKKSDDSRNADRDDWIQRQRRKKQQEREERERVLNLIRHDHEERKAKEEQRKQSIPVQETPQPPKPLKNTPQQFRLQVRLFDGSSIRNSFSPDETIHGNVRPWLDSQRSDGDAPYTLKHILTPLPNRTISLSEEEESLSDLNIGPTATLVMVPVREYTEAYTSSGASIPYRVLSGGYGLVASTVGAVAGALGTFLGIGQVPPSSSSNTPSPATEPTTEQQTPRPSRQGARNPTYNTVRTLHDSRAGQDDQQFYNGNQVCSTSTIREI